MTPGSLQVHNEGEMELQDALGEPIHGKEWTTLMHDWLIESCEFYPS